MTVKKPNSRAQMSAKERALRSKITQLVSEAPLVRGSVAVREKKCGKKGCRCADGELHRGVYLALSLDGKLRQVSIPVDTQTEVREWVDNYQRIRDFLEEVSRLHIRKVRKNRET